MLIMYFKERIQKTESYYIYDGLTLIAEMGGYVGLFLGFSVNQIVQILDSIYRSLKTNCLGIIRNS